MKQLTIASSITNREQASLGKYFTEIARIDLLTAREEVALAGKIRQGDQQAVEKLTSTNLRFVVSVAKQYQNQGLTLGDLINEGNIGLIMAARRYDETRGFKFISHAVWWIRQSILTALARSARTVRLPYNQIVLSAKVRKSMLKLEQSNGRTPSPEEVAEHLDVTGKAVAEALSRAADRVLSIDEPFSDEEDGALIDMLKNDEPLPDQQCINHSASAVIFDALNILEKIEKELLILYYGLGDSLPQSLEEISSRLKITKSKVGRLRDKALNKLRHSAGIMPLRSLLIA